VTKIQNTVLTRLGEPLGILTGGEVLKEIDLQSPLTPILDVRNSMEWSIGKMRRYIKTVAATAAGNPNRTTVGFNNLVDWTEITGPNDSRGVPNPSGYSVYPTAFSLNIASAAMADLVNASVSVRRSSDGLQVLYCRWVAADLIDGYGAPSICRTLPFWHFNTGFDTVLEANMAADEAVTFIIDGVSLPEAIVSRIRP